MTDVEKMDVDAVLDSLNAALRLQYRSALQYLARKTRASQLVIERFLTDVAYYLDVPEIRRMVIDIVAADVRRAAADHEHVVLVTHSLGTAVGYDLFDTLRSAARGGFAVHPMLLRSLVARSAGQGAQDLLTAREQQVLALLAQGRDPSAIARTLGDCTVVTTDSDLAAVPGLRTENWAEPTAPAA